MKVVKAMDSQQPRTAEEAYEAHQRELQISQEAERVAREERELAQQEYKDADGARRFQLTQELAETIAVEAKHASDRLAANSFADVATDLQPVFLVKQVCSSRFLWIRKYWLEYDEYAALLIGQAEGVPMYLLPTLGRIAARRMVAHPRYAYDWYIPVNDERVYPLFETNFTKDLGQRGYANDNQYQDELKEIIKALHKLAPVEEPVSE